MTDNRMLPFITKTWNPIAGGPCPYQCYKGGCWANLLKGKCEDSAIARKYAGPFRLHEPAMHPSFKPDDFVAVQFMSDIGAPGIPREVLVEIFEAIKIHEEKGTRFLLLTKNPKFYHDWCYQISEETTMGATIETDWSISSDISQAPLTFDRIAWMMWIADNLPNKRFVCVEPIMKMSPDFGRDLLKIRLRPPNIGVAVGYDNYENNLPEPSKERTELFIKELEDAGVTVYRKTIREAWDQ